MQILCFLLVLYAFITAAHSESDLFSENVNENTNLFSDASLDSTTSELSLNPPETWTENSSFLLDDNVAGNSIIDGDAGSDLLLASNVELDSTLPSTSDTLDWDIGSDSGLISSSEDADLASLVSSADPTSLLRDTIWDNINSPLAQNDHACQVSSADDVTFSGKRRRAVDADQCKSPEADVNKDTGPDPYVPGPMPYTRSTNYDGYAFPEKFDICSTKIFKTSNTPVCKEEPPAPDQSYFQPGQSWMHLYDVSPRTFYASLRSKI